MKQRVSLVIPDELNDALIELRKTDEFCRCSYSEIIRRLMEMGLEAQKEGK